MIYCPAVGGDVARTQRAETIDVVCMPIAEVLNFRMAAFYFSKNILLVLAILEQCDRRPLGPWP